MKKLSIILIVMVAGCLKLAAQSIPVDPKPGKVSLEEVALTAYPLDTTARAVMLVEKNEVEVRTSEYVELSRRIYVYERIKILKEDGKSLSDYKIPYPKDDAVHKIKVCTYNLVDGKVVESKLDKKFIFRESVSDNIGMYSFSAPDVRVGSVVEVSYELTGEDYWDIPELQMQHGLPVNLVEATMCYPDFLNLNRMGHGYLAPAYERITSQRNLLVNALPYCTIIQDKFTLTDVPAIPRESYSMCPDQYRCSVSYEISGITIPGVLYKQYSMQWPDVDASVRQSSIKDQCELKGKLLEPFLPTETEEMAAIVQVRNAVAGAIKWNGNHTLVPGSVKDALKEGSGSSATINALVASVLNKVGYEVDPLLVRRRTRGALASYYVRTDAFTDMLLRIQTPSGAVYYMDAAPDYGYVNVIDPVFLVKDARVVPLDAAKPGYWADLTTLAGGVSNITVHAALQEDGRVEGTIGLAAFKESSYLVRETRDGKDSDEKYFEMVEDGEDYETISGSFGSTDYSANAAFTIQFEQQPSSAGDFLYVKPFLVTEHHPGDFPPVERHTPVDFPILDSINYVYDLQVPEGYAVEQLPDPVSIRSASFKARAACQAMLTEGNVVKLSFSYRNASLQVPATDYQDLRAFWEQLCKIYQGTIVLKKL